eukprot:TRINITY_DN1492_c0_g1_i1.p1 TRINITY_DN1492_c0_g1~~TRINITY_DN1492_c0_g1_i1.p1  ORF type:complete len:208 (+),score=1.88 TRINITY_DN1492_c0_g1_i1:38-625(+)
MSGPPGYNFVCWEGERHHFHAPHDVAYGANGSYVYRQNVTGHIHFCNDHFGDPIGGTRKAGWSKPHHHHHHGGGVQVNFSVPGVSISLGGGGPSHSTPSYPTPSYPTPGYPGPVYPGPGYPGPGYPSPVYGLAPGFMDCCSENESRSFPTPVDLAYGGNGQFTYRNNVVGWISFDNNTFGDPAPGVVKRGYVRRR